MSTHRTPLAVVSLLLLTAASAQAGTLRVPHQYSTIQAAVAEARDGDTVEIAAGLYAEDVIVSARSGITFKSAAGTLATVRSLSLAYCERTRVQKLRFSGGDTLLSLWDCDNSRISDCQFNGGRNGLALTFSDRAVVSGCRFESVRTGLLASHASVLTLQNNLFKSASVNSLYLSQLQDARNLANTFQDSGPAEIRSSAGADLFNNSFSGAALYVRTSNGVTVSANTLHNVSEAALLLEQCRDALVEKNDFKKCSEGIKIVQGGGHTLFKNVIKKCGNYGVQLWSTGNLIKKNTIAKSGIMDLWDSTPTANTYVKNQIGTSNL